MGSDARLLAPDPYQYTTWSDLRAVFKDGKVYLNFSLSASTGERIGTRVRQFVPEDVVTADWTVDTGLIVPDMHKLLTPTQHSSGIYQSMRGWETLHPTPERLALPDKRFVFGGSVKVSHTWTSLLAAASSLTESECPQARAMSRLVIEPDLLTPADWRQLGWDDWAHVLAPFGCKAVPVEHFDWRDPEAIAQVQAYKAGVPYVSVRPTRAHQLAVWYHLRGSPASVGVWESLFPYRRKCGRKAFLIPPDQVASLIRRVHGGRVLSEALRVVANLHPSADHERAALTLSMITWSPEPLALARWLVPFASLSSEDWLLFSKAVTTWALRTESSPVSGVDWVHIAYLDGATGFQVGATDPSVLREEAVNLTTSAVPKRELNGNGEWEQSPFYDKLQHRLNVVAVWAAARAAVNMPTYTEFVEQRWKYLPTGSAQGGRLFSAYEGMTVRFSKKGEAEVKPRSWYEKLPETVDHLSVTATWKIGERGKDRLIASTASDINWLLSWLCLGIEPGLRGYGFDAKEGAIGELLRVQRAVYRCRAGRYTWDYDYSAYDKQLLIQREIVPLLESYAFGIATVRPDLSRDISRVMSGVRRAFADIRIKVPRKGGGMDKLPGRDGMLSGLRITASGDTGMSKQYIDSADRSVLRAIGSSALAGDINLRGDDVDAEVTSWLSGVHLFWSMCSAGYEANPLKQRISASSSIYLRVLATADGARGFPNRSIVSLVQRRPDKRVASSGNVVERVQAYRNLVCVTARRSGRWDVAREIFATHRKFLGTFRSPSAPPSGGPYSWRRKRMPQGVQYVVSLHSEWWSTPRYMGGGGAPHIGDEYTYKTHYTKDGLNVTLPSEFVRPFAGHSSRDYTSYVAREVSSPLNTNRLRNEFLVSSVTKSAGARAFRAMYRATTAVMLTIMGRCAKIGPPRHLLRIDRQIVLFSKALLWAPHDRGKILRALLNTRDSWVHGCALMLIPGGGSTISAMRDTSLKALKQLLFSRANSLQVEWITRLASRVNHTVFRAIVMGDLSMPEVPLERYSNRARAVVSRYAIAKGIEWACDRRRHDLGGIQRYILSWSQQAAAHPDFRAAMSHELYE